MEQYAVLAKNFNVLRVLQFEEKYHILKDVDLYAAMSIYVIYQKLLSLLKLYDSNQISYPGKQKTYLNFIKKRGKKV